MNQKFDQLMALPLDPGYSQQTIQGRMELLERARAQVFTSKGKTRAENPEVVIQFAMVPGTLALMAQVGAWGVHACCIQMSGAGMLYLLCR